jgi:broad specificity phosphatase PhoE
MHLFLARHGETIWNAMHRLQGQTDIALTERGEEQARALATLMADVRLDAVYASPLQRSLETARPVAQAHGLEPIVRPELREIGYGILEGYADGDDDAELAKLWEARRRDPLHFRAPGGETYAELRHRVAAFTAHVRQVHPSDTILVVGHRGTNRALLSLWLDRPLTLEFKHKHDRVLEIRPRMDPEVIQHRHAPTAEPRSRS